VLSCGFEFLRPTAAAFSAGEKPRIVLGFSRILPRQRLGYLGKRRVS